MKLLLNRISSWVDSEYVPDARALGIFRILFSLASLASYPAYQWLAGVPDTFYHPPISVALLFTGFPDPWMIYAFDFVIVLLLVLLAFGLFTAPVSILLGAAWLFANSFAYSLAKIDHTILGVLIPFVGAFAGWGRHYSMDGSIRRRVPSVAGWPMATFALVISFAMLTAAIPKIESGWLSFDGQSVRGYMLHYYHALGQKTWLAEVMLYVQAPYFWEMLDWSTVLFEFGFVFFVWNVSAFRFFCVLAVFFHLGVYFSMGIFFDANLLAYGMFVPWQRLLPVRQERSVQAPTKAATWSLGAVPALGLATAWMTMEHANPIGIISSLFGITAPDAVKWSIIAVSFFLIGWFGLQLVGIFPRNRAAAGEGPVVLFDGVCGLCNKWVDFILKIDRRGVIRFASLQSETGTRLLREHGLKEGYFDSIVLVQNGRALTKSDAVLEVKRATGTVWSVMNFFSVLPRYFRDTVYNLIAANRYRLFGKHETCRLPSPEERARFVDV